MDNKLIEELSCELRHDEGFSAHTYEDSKGYQTIGFGRLVDLRLGGGITKKEAQYLLNNDIRRSIRELDSALPWWRRLGETRRRALLNMHHNLGMEGLLSFRKMLAALKIGDYDKAFKEALDSLWATQVGKRANRIAYMFKNGSS